MRLRHLLWWCLAIVLVPVLLPQALLTRRRSLRLPEASGAREGLCGETGSPLRLLLIGESTAAGVGVEDQQQALAAQLAFVLAKRLQRTVAWRALGESGVTAEGACQRLLPGALSWPADICVLVLGVNDTTRVTSLGRWRRALQCLSAGLAGSGAQLVFSGVPPLQDFPALPGPLRQLLGLRAALLDRVLAKVVWQCGGLHCALAVRLTDDSLAEDGYHPSAMGYRRWAEGLADAIIAQGRWSKG